jgi:hypothetical protein
LTRWYTGESKNLSGTHGEAIIVDLISCWWKPCISSKEIYSRMHAWLCRLPLFVICRRIFHACYRIRSDPIDTSRYCGSLSFLFLLRTSQLGIDIGCNILNFSANQKIRTF